MSDSIKHECGIALIRLLQPLDYYAEKYGSALYGLNKLYLLMQKQQNRGQDGVGMASIKLAMPPGYRYISRKRFNTTNALRDLFEHIYGKFEGLSTEQLRNGDYLRNHHPYIGEVYMGHLRYGTHGQNTIEACHPFLRTNNWITRNLLLAGNFNLTNVEELFNRLVSLGQHPKEKADTVTVMERIGHFLDNAVEELFQTLKEEGYTNEEITPMIAEQLDLQDILYRAARKFDGGYVMAGIVGHGDAFVMRDPNGIRPAYYYADEEVIVVASERPAIQTAFDVLFKEVREIQPGHALIIKQNGAWEEKPFTEPRERRSCSFERIYFSRGNDREIYLERQELGRQLATKLLEEINYDLANSIFAFVPNTAETAFLGLVKGVEDNLDLIKRDRLLALGSTPTPAEVGAILQLRPRIERIAVKDVKLRTFIAEDATRSELVSHVYDVTYGIIRDWQDTLILLDDSIVRGTTLRESILRIAARLRPKKIIILSSAPQIRYPDCYGIDMSKLSEFVAFNALIDLIKSSGRQELLHEAYRRAKEQEMAAHEQPFNVVQYLYSEVSDAELTQRITEIVTPADIQSEVVLIFQTIEGLHQACPNHMGDWYFTGNYPTLGGIRVVNRSFMNYMEGKNERAY